jgi:hypothetical protein
MRPSAARLSLPVNEPLKTRGAADDPIQASRRNFEERGGGGRVAFGEIQRGRCFIEIEGKGLGAGQPWKIRQGEEFIGRWSAHGGAIVIPDGPSGDGSVKTTHRRRLSEPRTTVSGPGVIAKPH